jgi:hypothetical protein
LFDPIITRRIGLIRRKGRSFTPAAEKLYELLLGLRPGQGRKSLTKT